MHTLREGDTLALGFVVGRDGRATFTDVLYRLSGLTVVEGECPHARPARPKSGLGTSVRWFPSEAEEE